MTTRQRNRRRLHYYNLKGKSSAVVLNLFNERFEDAQDALEDDDCKEANELVIDCWWAYRHYGQDGRGTQRTREKMFADMKWLEKQADRLCKDYWREEGRRRRERERRHKSRSRGR